MLMVTYTKVNGSMIRPLEKAFISIITVQNMMESGLMTISTVKEWKHGLTAANIRDNIRKERRTDMANIPGKMEVSMSESGKTTR